MCSREYPETSTERGAPLGGGPRGPGQAGSAGPLSLRPSGGFRLCRRKPEHSRCRCPAGARVPPWPVDAAAPLSTRTEEGDGEEPVHMPGSLVEAAAGACAPSLRRLGRRGARAPLRARTLARSRRPEASPPALRVGATQARARVVSGRPEWPGSLGSRPPPPPPGSQPTRPSLSSRNGSGAARGRAPWTRLALGLALSAAAWLAPPCAFPQSVAPKAPLSGGRGSCFRFFLSLQSGVASSTPAPLPLSRRGQLQLKAAAVATGDGADRLAPAAGKGALGSRAPRAGDSRTGRARALRSLGSRRSFVLPPIPGLLLQLLQLLLSQRPREKWGGSLRDAPALPWPLG